MCVDKSRIPTFFSVFDAATSDTVDTSSARWYAPAGRCTVTYTSRDGDQLACNCKSTSICTLVFSKSSRHLNLYHHPCGTELLTVLQTLTYSYAIACCLRSWFPLQAHLARVGLLISEVSSHPRILRRSTRCPTRSGYRASLNSLQTRCLRANCHLSASCITAGLPLPRADLPKSAVDDSADDVSDTEESDSSDSDAEVPLDVKPGTAVRPSRRHPPRVTPAKIKECQYYLKHHRHPFPAPAE